MQEADRHLAGRGGCLGLVAGVEVDVEAGVAEFDHRLAIADSQRADDAWAGNA